ncbi:hypothetical protein BE221DRAFT_64274 [Ostreococcus tauri]|uniref:Uncharacterized protein n=1 Tax=Ostreococcus tauri TaxID=70448 RepID=A0A1Y5HX31_OSTTA|nr:hypothetical protein BE221DRAFT_64274 [Ostreococcus tauri]
MYIEERWTRKWRSSENLLSVIEARLRERTPRERAREPRTKTRCGRGSERKRTEDDANTWRISIDRFESDASVSASRGIWSDGWRKRKRSAFGSRWRKSEQSYRRNEEEAFTQSHALPAGVAARESEDCSFVHGAGRRRSRRAQLSAPTVDAATASELASIIKELVVETRELRARLSRAEDELARTRAST